MSGPRKHKVVQGESIESIAHNSGHLWKTIWEHPDNDGLRQKRSNAHVLCPGDLVCIPAIKVKTVTIGTGKRHTFRIRSTPSRLRVKFMRDGEPRANQEYLFEVDGLKRSGTTDGDGFLNESVSPRARRAIVRFRRDEAEDEDHTSEPFEEKGEDIVDEQTGQREEMPQSDQEWELYVIDLRCLDPSSETTGAQGRLRNLGYPVGAVDGEKGPRTTDGLKNFQEDHGLEVTGELDEATQKKLAELTEG